MRREAYKSPGFLMYVFLLSGDVERAVLYIHDCYGSEEVASAGPLGRFTIRRVCGGGILMLAGRKGSCVTWMGGAAYMRQ